MEGLVRRRAFVGTLVAGLPMLAGGGIALAQRNSGALIRGDALELELRRQFRDSVRGMQGPRRGESARHAAATLRLIAADFSVRNIDAQIQTQLRAAVRREGEAALLTREVDPRMLAAETREFGLSQPHLPSHDYAARQHALKSLLDGGITPIMVAVASQFEALGEELDRQPFQTVSARRVTGCPDMRVQLLIVEAAMITACLVNPIACAIFAGMYTGLQIGLATMGC